MNLASYIDHTLLQSGLSEDHWKNFCYEANKHRFWSVCIPSFWIPYVKKHLSHEIKIATVIGFPLGYQLPEVKKYEALQAVAWGADEIDMVIHLDALKNGWLDTVIFDIRGVCEVALGKVVKVIIESHTLTEDQKSSAVECIIEAGAHFVKTCTGFSGGGATLDDVNFLKNVIGERPLKIKASGGIRNRDFAVALIHAGAHRLGTSSGPKILNDQEASSSTY